MVAAEFRLATRLAGLERPVAADCGGASGRVGLRHCLEVSGSITNLPDGWWIGVLDGGLLGLFDLTTGRQKQWQC